MTLPAFDPELFHADLQAAVDAEWQRAASDATPRELRELIDGYLKRPARLVRPRVLWEAAGWSGAAAHVVPPLAVATEALHVFALMHDDGIDGDIDDPLAVIAGDMFYALGFGLVAETVASHRLDVGIISLLRQVAATTAVGQADDVVFPDSGGPESGLGALYRLYDRKTGLYTFVAPLQIGAMAGSADPQELARLETAGRHLGRAFQLRDDLTDIRGSLSDPADPPPWELNLAHCWAVTKGRPRGSTAEREAWVDMDALESWGREQIEACLSAAEAALAGLRPAADGSASRLENLGSWVRDLVQPTLQRRMT